MLCSPERIPITIPGLRLSIVVVEGKTTTKSEATMERKEEASTEVLPQGVGAIFIKEAHFFTSKI